MQEKNADGKEAAAARLMKLKKLDESDAEFARRLGLTSQHIHNWGSGTHGLSLKMAAKIAPKLTDAELVYVVAGRELGSPENADADDAARRLALIRRFADPSLHLSEEAYDRLLDEAERLVEVASNRGGA